MDIGQKVKRIRQEKGLTQDELARRCELSKGFISQLEHDSTSPSLNTLVNILESLGTNPRDFFNDFTDERIVFTKDDFYEVEDKELKYQIEWVVPNAQKNNMEPIVITMAPGGRYKEEIAHEGEEFGFIMAGSIYIHYGNKRFKAKKGDTFSFISNVNHYISNAGKTQAKVLWISAPHSFY
jgi:transcriptional regulator with XRE-family HTH domain